MPDILFLCIIFLDCCPECRDVLLPLLVDQLSGQLDDNSSKPDHEASSQLLSNILEVLDRKEVVSEYLCVTSHNT